MSRRIVIHKPRWSDERGAAAVEFAMMLPVFVLILFGVIEFGSIYNTQVMLTSAASDGARSMAIDGDPAGAEAVVLAAAIGLRPELTASDISVSPAACSPTNDVTVQLSYDKPLLTGLFGTSIELTVKATLPCSG